MKPGLFSTEQWIAWISASVSASVTITFILLGYMSSNYESIKAAELKDEFVKQNLSDIKEDIRIIRNYIEQKR